MGKLIEPVMEIDLPFKRIGSENKKVRELFEIIPGIPGRGPPIGLLYCSDRVSAFNVVLKTGIPGKGIVLNYNSAFWQKKTKSMCPNHFITVIDDNFFDKDQVFLWGHDQEEIRRRLEPFREKIIHRSSLVEIGRPILIEAIVRDRLLGSAWDQYQETGMVNGIILPKGLKKGDKLPAPIFTPTLKSKDDEPITYEQLVQLVGARQARLIRAYSLSLFCYAQNHAILMEFRIDDTKFEYIMSFAGIVKQSDESLTGDSSRFTPDKSKQIIRDYLDSIKFDRKTPIELPIEIIMKAGEAYYYMLEKVNGIKIEQLIRV